MKGHLCKGVIQRLFESLLGCGAYYFKMEKTHYGTVEMSDVSVHGMEICRSNTSTQQNSSSF